MARISRSALMKWGIILLLAIPHVFLVMKLKNDYQGILSVLPVSATGWFFGIVPGAVAALLALLHYALALRLSNISWPLILNNNFIIGMPLLIAIGAMAGWAKDVYGKQSLRDLELTKRLQEADALAKINM